MPEAVLLSWEDYSSPPFEPGSGLAVVKLSHPIEDETEVEISFSHMKRPYTHEAVVYQKGTDYRLDLQEFDTLENVLLLMGYTLVEEFTPVEPRSWQPIPETSSKTITLMLGMRIGKNPVFVTLEATRQMRDSEVLCALYKLCQNDCGFGWLNLIDEESGFRVLSASCESSPSMSVGDFVVFTNSTLPESNRIYRCDFCKWTEVQSF